MPSKKKTTSSVIRLRPATPLDASSLWEWRNEHETRAASYHSEPIAYEDHLRWFQVKLRDPNTRILIATNASNEEVGYARLDLDGDQAEINLSIDQDFRNCGLGKTLIGAVARFAVKEVGLHSVVAHIKHDNAASLTAFEQAGFIRVATLKVVGQDSVRMVYRDPVSHATKGD